MFLTTHEHRSDIARAVAILKKSLFSSRDPSLPLEQFWKELIFIELMFFGYYAFLIPSRLQFYTEESVDAYI